MTEACVVTNVVLAECAVTEDKLEAIDALDALERLDTLDCDNADEDD